MWPPTLQSITPRLIRCGGQLAANLTESTQHQFRQSVVNRKVGGHVAANFTKWSWFKTRCFWVTDPPGLDRMAVELDFDRKCSDCKYLPTAKSTANWRWTWRSTYYRV